ncbi:unnamed protein product [Camellia sinensis]
MGLMSTNLNFPNKICLEMWLMATRVCMLSPFGCRILNLQNIKRHKKGNLKFIKLVTHRIICSHTAIDEIETTRRSIAILSLKVVCWEKCGSCRSAYANI